MLLFILIPVQIQAQYVYFSPLSGCSSDGAECFSDAQEWHVFIRTEDISGVMGTHFRIDPTGYPEFSSDNILSITTNSQVTIVSGDLFTGMTLTWPTDLYSTDSLLTVTLDSDNMPSPYGTGITTRDIYLIRDSMPPIVLDDFEVHCTSCNAFWGGIHWLNPDTLTAVIGSETTIEFVAQAYGGGPGLTGVFFYVTDEIGWYQDCLDLCVVEHY